MESLSDVAVSAGCSVRLVGLVKRPDLNGSCGQAIKWIEQRGRWQVLLEDSKECQLFKPESLEKLSEMVGSVTETPVAKTTIVPVIRLASSDDATNTALVSALVQLVNDAYRIAMNGLVEDPSKFVRTDSDDIEERLQGIGYGTMRRYMVLAFVGAEVVGCSSVTTGWRHPRRGQFGMLAVGGSWQRQGIAMRLVAFAESHCKARGMEEMQCEELTCTDGSHDTSNWMMRFYKARLGYSVVDEYFCPKGHQSRGARTCRDLQFLIYRKSLEDRH